MVVLNLPPNLMREECCFGYIGSDKKLPALLCHVVTILSKKTDVTFFDANLERSSIEDVKQYLSHKKPDIVVCTISFNYINHDSRIFKICNDLNIKCIAIPIPFDYAEELISKYNLYFAIYSEPVKTLSNWCGNPNISELKGIVYKNNENVVINPTQEPSFHEITPINWDFFQLKKYNSFTYQIATGCPYDCVFCMWADKQYQLKPVDTVIEDLQYLEKQGVKFMFLLCSQITTNKRWLTEFCRKKIEKRIKILWHVDIRANELTRDMARLMRQAGCIRVFMGVETSNRHLMKKLNKQLTIYHVNTALNACEAEGLIVCIPFMFNIGENERHLRGYLEYIDHPPVHLATIGVTNLYVIPGTKLYPNKPKNTKLIHQFRRELRKRKPLRIAKRLLWLFTNKNAKQTLISVFKTFDRRVYIQFAAIFLQLST